MKWKFALWGQVIGMFLATAQPEFYGLRDVVDFAFLVGGGLPFAVIGLIAGYAFEYFRNR